MNPRKNSLVCIIVVGTLFIAWRASSMVSKYFPTQATASDMPTESAIRDEPVRIRSSPVDDAVNQLALTKANESIDQQSWGRDPFDSTPFISKPVDASVTQSMTNESAPPPPDLKLTGVSRAGSRWLAAVNGTIVGIGDVVQDTYRVVAITNSSLTLVSGGWAFRYELGEKTAQVRPWTENP